MEYLQIKSLILFSLTAVMFSSCGNDCMNGEGAIVTRELPSDEFSALLSTNSFNINIINSPEQRIVATGHTNIVSILFVEVSSGVLNMRLPSGCYNHFSLEIDIYTPILEAVSTTGSGNITLEAMEGMDVFTAVSNGSGSISSTGAILNSATMALTTTGSGGLDLSIEAETLTINQTGSGSIELSGVAVSQDITKSGSGNYRAFDLDSEKCSIINSGSGIAEISVSEELTGELTGSGSVFYRGEPSTIVNSTGSGVFVQSN